MRTIGLLLLCAFAGNATLNKDGMPGIHNTFSAEALGHGHMGIGVHGHVVDDEAFLDNGTIFVDGQQTYLREFLMANTNLFLSLGLGSLVDLGLSLPVYYQDLAGVGFTYEETHIGDLKYRAKFQIPYSPRRDIMNMALLLGGTVPTHNGAGVIPTRLEYYLNDPGAGADPFGLEFPTFLAALGMTFHITDLHRGAGFAWHLNGGIRKIGISEPEFDDVLFLSTALDLRLNPFIGFFAETYHAARTNRWATDRQFSTEPFLLTLGARAHSPANLDFQAGMVLGLANNGHTNVSYPLENNASRINRFAVKSAPDVSLYFQAVWNGPVVSQDNDRDGLKNDVDQCPEQAEDIDNFQDEDGCPDPDNDGDGIADVKDKCPMEPEDMDGFDDEDGCPDPDNDGDGVPDAEDKCPDTPQGEDGREGCPNIDKDGDGILDADDQCPAEAEDMDGFEDEDGCPDNDNDGDGIPDQADRCPNVPETKNDFEDEDGCPDKVSQKLQTIVLRGVNFHTGSARLTDESYGALDKVVEQLKANPKVQIEVAGHTDDRGSAEMNQRLSQARAHSVAEYFVQKGIDRARLKVIGYGESRPTASNRTAEGRAMNRRVELHLAE